MPSCKICRARLDVHGVKYCNSCMKFFPMFQTQNRQFRNVDLEKL